MFTLPSSQAHVETLSVKSFSHCLYPPTLSLMHFINSLRLLRRWIFLDSPSFHMRLMTASIIVPMCFVFIKKKRTFPSSRKQCIGKCQFNVIEGNLSAPAHSDADQWDVGRAPCTSRLNVSLTLCAFKFIFIVSWNFAFLLYAISDDISDNRRGSREYEYLLILKSCRTRRGRFMKIIQGLAIFVNVFKRI